MTDAIAHADDFPEPRKSCPSVGVAPALVVAVFGVQAVFVVALTMVGVGLLTAALLAVGLFVVDVLVLAARVSGLQAVLFRGILPALMRCAAAASVLPWSVPEGR